MTKFTCAFHKSRTFVFSMLLLVSHLNNRFPAPDDLTSCFYVVVLARDSFGDCHSNNNITSVS